MRECVSVQFRRASSFLMKLMILFILVSPYAFARAGGGRNGGGGLIYLILLPFLIAYAWYVNRRINKNKNPTVETCPSSSRTSSL